jgi:hypothetical protein
MGVCPGKEESGTKAEVGDPLAMAPGHSLNHAVQTKASEVVRHFALGDGLEVLPGESGELVAQISIGETAGQKTEPDQQMQ